LIVSNFMFFYILGKTAPLQLREKDKDMSSRRPVGKIQGRSLK
jgi:hypothetical protein